VAPAAAPVVEPVISAAAPVIEPEVATAAPVLEPVAAGAAPVVAAAGPIVTPVVSAAAPVVSAAAPVVEPVVAPVLGPAVSLADGGGLSNRLGDVIDLLGNPSPTPTLPTATGENGAGTGRGPGNGSSPGDLTAVLGALLALPNVESFLPHVFAPGQLPVGTAASAPAQQLSSLLPSPPGRLPIVFAPGGGFAQGDEGAPFNQGEGRPANNPSSSAFFPFDLGFLEPARALQLPTGNPGTNVPRWLMDFLPAPSARAGEPAAVGAVGADSAEGAAPRAEPEPAARDPRAPEDEGVLPPVSQKPPVRTPDLLTDFDVFLAAMENVFHTMGNAAEHLLGQAEQVPWSFWLALAALASGAYEMARRGMTRPPDDQLVGPGQPDLSAAG
jgi:hypothetical protein